MKKIEPSFIFLLIIGIFFIIYSEIKMRETTKTNVVTRSDAMFYHEYIAVHLFGMEPYLPREKQPVIKYTMGMAVSYLPAMAIGYVYTEIKGVDHDFGRNYIYQKLLYYIGFFYCFVGFIFLQRILKRWCNDWVILLVTGSIFFGTNLYYYIKVEPLMSHGINFALITLFLFYSLRFFDKPTLKYAAGMGIMLAFITLIRPINIIVAILPAVYWLSSKNTWNEKWNFIQQNFKNIGIILGCVLLAFIPQMIYWHHYTGQWMYYSYGAEKFFWGKPAILPILISFRKGWFLYTPLMLFIIPGAIICFKKNKQLFWAIFIFFWLNLYIISCWWCWWYGGSFGMRPLIDIYGVLAIWIAMFMQYLWGKSKPVLVVAVALIGFLIYVNLYQTRQARICWIHYDSMTYKAYKRIFLNETQRKKLNDAEWNALLDPPDYDKAIAGERFW